MTLVSCLAYRNVSVENTFMSEKKMDIPSPFSRFHVARQYRSVTCCNLFVFSFIQISSQYDTYEQNVSCEYIQGLIFSY